DGHDAHAVRPLDHGDGLVAMPLDAHVARIGTETLDLVVTDDCPSGLLDDDAASLLDDVAIALAHLASLTPHVVDAAGSVERRRGGLPLRLPSGGCLRLQGLQRRRRRRSRRRGPRGLLRRAGDRQLLCARRRLDRLLRRWRWTLPRLLR